jgi:tetratricopeptide (TPR) repeat protein
MDANTAMQVALCLANNPENVGNIVLTYRDGRRSAGWYAAQVRLGEGVEVLLRHHPSIPDPRPDLLLPFEDVAHVRVTLGSGGDLDFGAMPSAGDVAAVEALVRQVSQLYQRGRIAQARGLAAQAVEGARRLGARHPLLAITLANHGEILRLAGQLADAAPVLEEAVTVAREAHPADSPHLAGALNNLAAVHCDAGRHALAEPLLIEVLAIRRRSDPTGELVAQTLCSMGLVHQSTDRFDSAEVHCREGLRILEEKSRRRSPLYARLLHNLGVAQGRRGEIDLARRSLTESLELRLEILGENHPETVEGLSSLGTLHFVSQSYAEALPRFERALALIERGLGRDHVRVAEAAMNIALCLKMQRRPADLGRVLSLVERAVAIRERHLGAAHPLSESARRELREIRAALPS